MLKPVSPIVIVVAAPPAPTLTCSLPEVVSMLRSGRPVVEVAIVHAYGVLLTTVVVAAEEKYMSPPETVSCVVEEKVLNVEEAISEKGEVAVSQSAVEVALTFTPLYVVWVNGKAPAEEVMPPQATMPEEFVVSALEPEHADIPEMLRFVEEAVVNWKMVPEIAVVEAKLRVCAAVALEVMTPVEEIEVVAVAPKLAVLAERLVVEALVV